MYKAVSTSLSQSGVGAIWISTSKFWNMTHMTHIAQVYAITLDLFNF